ncbi:MAG: hypothetical protein H7X70_06020 [Candidatus Kapabacteria bacterium]|nr:hypothetical protein [Candidatus Kapabacteria bacterium]
MITSRNVVRFWIPLSFTWMMMSMEGTILASFIARLPFDTVNLAAYGVAVALAMFIESPVIHLLSTSVALARDRASMIALRSFAYRINTIVTMGMLVVCIPWVYDRVTLNILQLPIDVASLMYWGFVSMIPWPAAIGYRRFYQGLLIRNGRTRLVAYGTIVRLITMLCSAITLMLIGTIPGVLVGTLSLTIGVICEAAMTKYMVRDVIKMYERADVVEGNGISTAEIVRFWLPLAATSAFGFAVTPMLAFFMSRAPDPLASLAVLPVVDSFVFFFRSFGFSYQEVGVALIGDKQQNYAAVRRVGLGIIICTSVILSAIVFTPLLGIVYKGLYGLQPELAGFATVPTMVLVVLPSIAVAYSLYRSVLITARQNVKVTISTILEVGGIALIMVLLVTFTELNGALSAAISMAVGRIMSTVYLKWTAVSVLASR